MPMGGNPMTWRRPFLPRTFLRNRVELGVPDVDEEDSHCAKRRVSPRSESLSGAGEEKSYAMIRDFSAVSAAPKSAPPST